MQTFAYYELLLMSDTCIELVMMRGNI